jgi:hypothetical protein
MISVFTKGTGRTPSGWFDEHAGTWVEHGLVSNDQVEAIREFELASTSSVDRLPIAAELAVYLGSVLALMSGAMIVAQTWDTMNLTVRLAIGVVLGALGFAAGARLIRLDDGGTRRLASFMWLIGTGGVALATGVLVDAAAFAEPGWNAMLIGLPVLVIGGALWRNLERPLQVATTAIGAGLTLGGLGALAGIPPWTGGIIVWLAATLLTALAISQRVRPELYILAVAAVAAMLGAAMLADLSELAGAAAATVTAAGIVAVGLARHLVPILVIGVISFLQSLQGLLMTTLDGTMGAGFVAAIGVTMVVVVIARSTHRTSTGAGEGPGPPPAS